MRDINRIDIVLEKIKFLWKKFPDLRLGQLLGNTMNYTALYYVEDDQLLNALSNCYKVDLSEVKIIDTKDTPSLAENMKAVGIANKGKVYVHKDADVRLIKKEELEDYLNKGYKTGRKDK